MRRRRLRGQNDSLDLLLDTICNAFGGIIFIAVLIAMLVRNGDTASDPALAKAEEAMTKRAIERVQYEIKRYGNIESDNEKQSGPIAEKLKTIGELKLRLSQVGPPSAGPADQTAIQPKVISIREAQKGDRKLIEEISSKQAELIDEIVKRKSAAELLAQMIAEVKGKHNETLRFPRQNANTKRRPYFVFLREKGVFADFSASLDVRDTGRFDIVSLPGEKRIMPKNGMGMMLSEGKNASLEAQLKAVDSNNFFIFILLYPDSYEAWREFRRILISLNLDDYGIEFFAQNQSLVLVSHGGSAILPQGGN